MPLYNPAGATAPLTLTGTSDTKQLIVKANGTQNQNIQDWQSSAGGFLAAIAANGSGLFQNIEVGSGGHNVYNGNGALGLQSSTHVLLKSPTVIEDADGTGYIEFPEQSADAAAPAANNIRLYAKDNGSGKTQIVARFPTGAVQVIATEP